MRTGYYKCLQFGIPLRFHKNGRPLDQNYAPEELLFHRIEPDPKIPFRYPNGKINPAIFKHLNKMSVNRRAYSLPSQVLYNEKTGAHFLDWAILKIASSVIAEFREKHPDFDKKPEFRKHYTLAPKHLPKNCNYSHSEIQAYEEIDSIITRCGDDDFSKTTKKQIRQFYADKFDMEKDFGVPNVPYLLLESGLKIIVVDFIWKLRRCLSKVIGKKTAQNKKR